MALADKIAKAVGKPFPKIGGDVTFRVISTGAYNTTTGAVTETASDTTIKGALDSVSEQEVNELVQASDKKLTVPASSFSSRPSTADKVVISSVVHQVIAVNVTEMQNVDIAYELILRA